MERLELTTETERDTIPEQKEAPRFLALVNTLAAAATAH